jgi:hypothetical protein
MSKVKKYVKVVGDVSNLRGFEYVEVIAEIPCEPFSSGIAIIAMNNKGIPESFDASIFELSDKR